MLFYKNNKNRGWSSKIFKIIYRAYITCLSTCLVKIGLWSLDADYIVYRQTFSKNTFLISGYSTQKPTKTQNQFLYSHLIFSTL